MRIHQITIFLAFILAGIVLSSIVSIYPCSADTNQFQVTVTSSPPAYTPGGSCQIHVTVTYNGQPAPNVPVQFLITGSQATISPASGSTDTSGSLSPATLVTTSSTSGVIHVLAQAYSSFCPNTYAGAPCTAYSGEGFVDILQEVQAQPQAPVYQPAPEPQPYQPPPQQPYQPPPQQPYQPPQPPAATSQQPVAVINVDRYAGNMPLDVMFDGRKSYAPGGSIVMYAWDFGDGSTGRGYVAQHQYTNPGTFTASLVVTDNNERSSIPATIQITGGSTVQAPVYNIGGSCDDGNKCTVNDKYDASGKCIAGQPLNCDDNDPNTADSCNPVTGCVHTPIKPVQPEKPAPQPSAVPTPTNEVTTCMKITSPGYYLLKNDITADPQTKTCIEIRSSDVTFDGNGNKKITVTGNHIIDSNGIFANAMGAKNAMGEPISSISNVVVKNVDVSNWWSGIEFWDVNGGSISGCTLHDNVLIPDLSDQKQDRSAAARSHGINIATSKNIEITNNVIRNNNIGISLAASSKDIKIGKLPTCPTFSDLSGGSPPSTYENAIVDNNWYGISLVNSDNNHIIGNTISGSREETYTEPSGIYFQGSKNNEIILNTIWGNHNGIYLSVESTANNFDKNKFILRYSNPFTNNYRDFYVSKDCLGYLTNPVGKTCENPPPRYELAESQVQCTIMGFISGQCGQGNWYEILTGGASRSHVSTQPTPSGGEGTGGTVATPAPSPSVTVPNSSMESMAASPGCSWFGFLTGACGQGKLSGITSSPVSSQPKPGSDYQSDYRLACSVPLSPCNGRCADVQTDAENCGACGKTCTKEASCQNGICVTGNWTCKTGMTSCSGSCADLQTDSSNCGSCGHVCGSVKKCCNGYCQSEMLAC